MRALSQKDYLFSEPKVIGFPQKNPNSGAKTLSHETLPFDTLLTANLPHSTNLEEIGDFFEKLTMFFQKNLTFVVYFEKS